MRVLCLFSGGLDSTVMVERLISQGNTVELLSYNYNQKHRIELKFASNFAKARELPHRILDISFYGGLIKSGLTGVGNNPVVNNRNMLMTVIAHSICIEEDFDALAIGVHSGDYEVFPDCRAEFFKSLQNTLLLSSERNMLILTPFITWNKLDIAREAVKLNVDVKSTYSCYNGGETPCRKCLSCESREGILRSIT